jgi:hypothetical protein
MPPIEVFVGMDSIKASAEEVPGLATRQELRQWLVEHDAIEKETEIFDSGELQTIKKFTKGALQYIFFANAIAHSSPLKLLHNEIYPLRTLT